jgi:phage-related protein
MSGGDQETPGRVLFHGGRQRAGARVAENAGCRQDIAIAEFGWPVGMPVCRLLGSGLYEIRSDLASHRIARVIFCVEGQYMVLLHGFIKKTRKTPQPDLGLALKRKREVTA